MIGTLSAMIGLLGVLLFISLRSLQMWFPIITGFLTGITGNTGVIVMTAFAYIADVSTSPQSRTIRMVIVSVCERLSYVIGNLLTGAASKTVRLRVFAGAWWPRG